MTAHDRNRYALSRRPAFVNVSVALLAVMASAGVPAPLYPRYETEFAVTAVSLTTSYGTYIVMATFAMLVLGRVSDFVGRRPVALAALATSALSCLVFIQMSGTATLVLGRGLQGLSAGLAMTAIGALVIDLKAPGTSFLASFVASASPTVGVALGAIASGLAVQFGPHPTVLVYVVALACLAPLMLGIVLSPETVQLPAEGRELAEARHSMRPALAIPAGARPIFLGAVAAFVASWTLGGFYQSLGPTLTTEVFSVATPLFAGLAVASVLGMTFAGGPLTARLPPRVASLTGLSMLTLGVLGILVSVNLHHSVAFIAASMLAGVGFGASTTGSMRALLAATGGQSSAGLLSAIYLASYTCAAFPAFLGGFFVPPFGLEAVTRGYGALVICLAIVAALILSLRSGRARPGPDGMVVLVDEPDARKADLR